MWPVPRLGDVNGRSGKAAARARRDREWGEAMSNDLQVEVDRLISIAHLHALNTLSHPEALRELHLDVCRGLWKHYAAAFTTDESQSDAFADALDRATRDLIAGIEQQQRPGAQTEGAAHVSDGKVPVPPSAIALEGLRPIFTKIVEQ